jgi:hypothetical protein
MQSVPIPEFHTKILPLLNLIAEFFVRDLGGSPLFAAKIVQ